ncbi:hypothetical protein SDC9_204739 [bioreactor metagenome]|uniref:Gfo/Idh/MocA-like oxidoreductase C-terminal domain-containing protein n=1 Tax=bioreactor metagenome TaxID=1076179 RepID=A0A645J019_9ZZZZ
MPAHVQLLAEFPAGYLLTVTCSWLNAKSPRPALHGHTATLSIGSNGDRLDLLPEKEFADTVDPESFMKLPAQDVREHEKNWFDCIRSGKRPNADIELAIRAQVVLSLAEISDQRKTLCHFDEATRKVTDGLGQDLSPMVYGSATAI